MTIFCLFGMIKDMLNPLPNSFNIFSNNFLKKLKIQYSSLNGFTIWTQLLIQKSHKNKMFINHQGRKKPIITLAGITGQKALNMG